MKNLSDMLKEIELQKLWITDDGGPIFDGQISEKPLGANSYCVINKKDCDRLLAINIKLAEAIETENDLTMQLGECRGITKIALEKCRNILEEK